MLHLPHRHRRLGDDAHARRLADEEGHLPDDIAFGPAANLLARAVRHGLLERDGAAADEVEGGGLRALRDQRLALLEVARDPGLREDLLLAGRRGAERREGKGRSVRRCATRSRPERGRAGIRAYLAQLRVLRLVARERGACPARAPIGARNCDGRVSRGARRARAHARVPLRGAGAEGVAAGRGDERRAPAAGETCFTALVSARELQQPMLRRRSYNPCLVTMAPLPQRTRCGRKLGEDYRNDPRKGSEGRTFVHQPSGRSLGRSWCAAARRMLTAARHMLTCVPVVQAHQARHGAHATVASGRARPPCSSKRRRAC